MSITWNEAASQNSDEEPAWLQSLALDQALAPWLYNAVLERVQLIKTERKLVIGLISQDLPAASDFYALKSALQNRFPMVQLEVCLKMIDITQIDFDQFQTYKPFILQELFSADYAAFQLLSSAEWSFSQGLLAIDVIDSIVIQQLLKHQADELIRGWFHHRFSYPLEVTITIADNRQEKLGSFQEQRRLEEDSQIESIQSALVEQQTQAKHSPSVSLQFGAAIDEPAIEIKTIQDEMRKAVVRGRIFEFDKRELQSGRTLYTFSMTDLTDSIQCKVFAKGDGQLEVFNLLQADVWLSVRGTVQYDTFAKELVLLVQDLCQIESPKRLDTAERKRVELHAHTQMSSLDGVVSPEALVAHAAKWGHSAIAITDHGVVQAFPDAYHAAKNAGIKCLLGMEAYVVDDGVSIVYQVSDANDRLLDENTVYVVFDTETTGLNAAENTLIEIAAVKMRGQEILEEWTTLIDPQTDISPKITELTGITNEMVKHQPLLAEALPEFRTFCSDAVLVAHNAEFDLGFISVCAGRIGMERWQNPVLDTLALSRKLYPKERNHRLKTLTTKFGVELVNHHRALDDTVATAKVFMYLLKESLDSGIQRLSQFNRPSETIDFARMRPYHTTILVQNKTGLKNLYKLVSASHIEYYYRVPRIPRSLLTSFREGLLIGSACQEGELFSGILRGKSREELVEAAKYYDYIEIQPLSHYAGLLANESIQSLDAVKGYHELLLSIGEETSRPVVATGDVHFLNEEDAIHREIFLQSQNSFGGGTQPPLYFRTTDEMLAEFSYLGAETAERVVVYNPQRIADEIEDVSPIPDQLYTPKIDGADDDIKQMCYDRAHLIYGQELPEVVAQRLERELNAIISNGFAVIYLIAHKLVKKSLDDGYLVGSRGSVGSSFVATMSEITEVNPLPPHYVCPNCQWSEFLTDGSVASGYDLPDKNCPVCQSMLIKDGQDIPFETFLGFEGDKVPDIDLNFSGDYQSIAHNYTKVLFGEQYVYRAGTIATVADKTAFGYVKKYMEDKGLQPRNAEMNRLVAGCTGVKRTTGQHPGGILVVPDHMDIYDFSPIQFPADDRNSEWKTTHFDFNAIHDNLLKLDILGHDDPTVIRMLQDLTGIDPKKIPANDEKVIGLFSGIDSLNVFAEHPLTTDKIRSTVGTYGIPEMGTKFVRQMLEDTKPKCFADLVQISGLSHGTDVWLNNAQEWIRKGVATISTCISTRDDIMVYLIYRGLEAGRAFKIMESVRKGKGLTPDDEAYMRSFQVPDWYIWSCKKIKYMFPKAHAVAYVLMAVRIAWFKVYYPLEFYATYFTVRADDFELDIMCSGYEAIVKKVIEIEDKGKLASPKEKSLLTVLEMAMELTARGYGFASLDLYRSHATKFQVLADERQLLPPFAAVSGLGVNAAKGIDKAREEGEFLSIQDFQSRSRVSKTVVELLEGLGCFSGLSETNQLSLF
ncbi:MAG: polC [Bacilli bacterium]|nr:polC [Bacilli bacterium]